MFCDYIVQTMPPSLTERLIAHAKQLKAEGKPIPGHLQKHLDAVGWREATGIVGGSKASEPGRQELIAAMFLLGASLGQLAQLFGGVKRSTISSYIKGKLTVEQRAHARQRGMWQPAISNERASEFFQCYYDNREALLGRPVIELAMALRERVTAPDVLDTDPNSDEIE